MKRNTEYSVLPPFHKVGRNTEHLTCLLQLFCRRGSALDGTRHPPADSFLSASFFVFLFLLFLSSLILSSSIFALLLYLCIDPPVPDPFTSQSIFIGVCRIPFPYLDAPDQHHINTTT
jgi:hypothetical protein